MTDEADATGGGDGAGEPGSEAGGAGEPTPWTDRIVGARMAVDSEFAPQVDASQFSRQEWGLVMTAVEFDIRQADSPDAELVADTETIRDVMPELERAREAQAAMAAGREPPSEGGGGFLDTVKGALGLDEDNGQEFDEARIRDAEDLADSYAVELQSYLEENGRWEEIRAAYREQQD
jgi:hypothetical protein